jgi:hydrogenase maturation protease
LKTVLLGIGNILLSDEGVGVHLVKEVGSKYEFTPEVDVVDGGTLGLDLLPYFEDYQRMLIVDAVNFGREPGFIRVVDGEEIPNAILEKMSVHNIGLNDLMGVSMFRGMIPEKIRLIGIQPASLEPGYLSPTIRDRMGELTSLVLKNLAEWGVEGRPSR